MKPGKTDFDVTVIGGGPAGSSVASFLAKKGLRCVVLERELFPRPHVGESLVPAATRVFRELDLLETLDDVGFPKKYGAVWTASANSPLYSHDWDGLEPDYHAAVRFEERPQPGVDRNYTYHVDRGKFDLILLKHAARLGADVHEGVRVSDVEFPEDEPARVFYRLGSKKMSVRTQLVVDASGRSTFLGNKLRLKVSDKVFDQYALHTWFEGYDRRVLAREAGMQDYIFVHFLPISNSWIWQIPITATITSIGVVTQKKQFAASRESRQAFFWNCLKTRPDLVENLRSSKQLKPLKDEADYSYAMRQICGDRFLLIGDAARFVDPIFSSGVSIALNSGRFASDDILKAFERGAFRRESFADFESRMITGMRNWYDFISLYYRLNVLFTAFLMDPRYRIDVLKLLQGDVYDELEPTVLSEMRRTVEMVEGNENHPWHSLLGDLTASAFKPKAPGRAASQDKA